MGQRIEFRFGKNSAFECDVSQIVGGLKERGWLEMLKEPWLQIRSSGGGTRLINTSQVEQIIVGLPEKEVE